MGRISSALSKSAWWFLRHSIRHKTASFIVVENVKVGIVLRLAQLAVFLYMSWSLLGNKSYFRYEVPYGHANVWMTGFDNPSDGYPLYCDNDQYDYYYSDDFVYVNNSCREFALGEAMEKLPDGGIFLLTYVQESWLDYKGCDAASQVCESKNTRSANYFVPANDGAVIWFDHVLTTSFLSTKDAALEMLDKDGNSIAEFAAGEPVRLTLVEALQAAGIDGLDTENDQASIEGSRGFAPFRLTGVKLNFHITYHNLHTWSGEEIIGTLEVQLVNTGWGGTGPRIDFVHENFDAETGLRDFQARDRYGYGLFARIDFSGEIGQPDFVTAINAIVTYSVMFALAGLVADFAAEMTPEVAAKFRDRKRAPLDRTPPRPPNGQGWAKASILPEPAPTRQVCKLRPKSALRPKRGMVKYFQED
ncbi:P2X receptor E [Hondaea fermentalgiana]|uniref:P2X receptor E n=1 Tax=Hondaea fermentalgiana TaxID=2315210 RepID=A0A2R5G8W1_9STRA|nr:P2X receptor E [Hondaea fermentalgiana]|eukprot:GBG24104.1 P2X receptor E [Hondaea fermentalgiana]